MVARPQYCETCSRILYCVIKPGDERPVKRPVLPLFLIVLATLIVIPSLHIPSASGSAPAWSFRDDFNYTSISQLQAAGWTTESIAPASYYSIGNSILTLLNDGHVGAGAGYSNVPVGVSDWSVSTRVDWIGSSGNVSGYVGSLQVAVQTAKHSYDWMADGYYAHFDIGMDGINVVTVSNYAKQLNVWHVLKLDMIQGTLYGYFDGQLIASYTEPDTTPGNTNLVNIQALASWETNNNFDWMQANNSPSPPVLPPSFSLKASPTSISLLAGQSGSSTIQVGSHAGFAGIVTLSQVTSPSGPSVQLSPMTVTVPKGGNATSTLTVSTQSTAPSNTYTITVTGTSGNLTSSITVTVTVNSAAADFSITDSATSIAIPVGSERQTIVTVESINGFSGNVSLVARPSSGAFACWFTYTLTSTATLFVPGGGYAYQYPTCGAGRPAGAYSLTISATFGSLNHTAVLSVTIQDFSITGPSSISFNAGSSKSESITFSSQFGLAGTVNLAVAGPSTLFESCPASITLASGGTATATCFVSSPTAGSNTLTITGTFICGDCYYNGKDTNTLTTTVTVIGPSVSDFFLSSSPSSLTIPLASFGISNLTLTSLNNFTGVVSLSSTVSTGLTVSISPNSVSLTAGGTVASKLTVTSTASTPTGSYNVTITGASGTRTHSIVLTVTVLNVDFTITESPISQIIPLGSEQQTVLELDSVNGFSGNVNLVATPSSSAIACWFTYTLTSTATLYVPPNGYAYQYPTCGAYGAAGSYTVTFSATSGSISHSVILAVTLVDFSIAASSASQASPTGNATVTLTSLSGLSGPISLAVSTPASLTVSCPPSASLLSGGTTVVSCSYSGAVGSYNVTFTGTFVCSGCYYNGRDSHSVAVTLKVLKPAPSDFSMSANPNGIAFSPGSSANSTVSLTSLAGFSGTVNLSVSVSPSGPTVSLSPVSITISSGGTGSSVLRISTISTVPIGTYAITVNAVIGSLSHSVQLSLSVSAASFTITETPTSQAIPILSEMQTVIEVNSVNAFSGNVNLVATPSSTAVACWFAYTLTNTATVTVSAGGYAYQWPTCGAYGPAGSYTVTITGTSGSISYSVVLAVTVMDFGLSASSVSFTQGSSGTSTITLTSLSGLSGPVSLTVTAPSGLTASCPPNATLSSGGTLIASCSFSSVAAGNYPATITGKFVCSGCYYDGTDSHSTTATVTVTSTDPPVSGTFNFQGITVTTSGSLSVNSGTVSGTVSVTATNSSTGTVLFSKTYTITNVKIGMMNQGRFILNVAVSPYRLSADVTVSQSGGVWSASVMVTRQLDIAGRGTVDIVDFSIGAVAFNTHFGGSLYNPAADLLGTGTVDINDIAMLVSFYGAPDYS